MLLRGCLHRGLRAQSPWFLKNVSVDFVRRTSLWLKLDGLCPRGCGAAFLVGRSLGRSYHRVSISIGGCPTSQFTDGETGEVTSVTRSFNLDCIFLSDEDICTWRRWFSC